MSIHSLFVSLFVLMWGGWFAVWNIMARRVKEPAQTEGQIARLSHIVPVVVAGYLLVAQAP